MSILTTIWPFSSPVSKPTTRDTQAEKTPSKPQAPANYATPRPQQNTLTAHLQPGTPEARHVATQLRRRAQSMMVRAQEIQAERTASKKKRRLLKGLVMRNSSTSRVQRSTRSRTLSLGPYTPSLGNKTCSSRVRTCTAPTPTSTGPRSSDICTHPYKLDIPSSTSTPYTASSPTDETQPPSPTSTAVLHSSLLDLENLVRSFSREFFTGGGLTVDPTSEKEKARVLCASFFWANSPETREFVTGGDGGTGWQDLWSDEDKRAGMVESVIWDLLKEWVCGIPWVEDCDGKEENAEGEEKDGEEDGLSTPHARFADVLRCITGNGTTLPPDYTPFIQKILAGLVAHLTPFLALMHENPYHELHRVLPPLLEITVAATMLSCRMWMRRDMVCRFREFLQDVEVIWEKE